MIAHTKLKVTKDTGRITAIENTSLTGSSSLAKGQIKIDNKTYETAYNMNNLLGYNVTYYVKNEGKNDESVILAMPIFLMLSSLTLLKSNLALGSYESSLTGLSGKYSYCSMSIVVLLSLSSFVFSSIFTIIPYNQQQFISQDIIDLTKILSYSVKLVNIVKFYKFDF